MFQANQIFILDIFIFKNSFYGLTDIFLKTLNHISSKKKKGRIIFTIIYK